MPDEHGQPASAPDEFDRALRDLTSGRAEPAKFKEPPAAERAKLRSVPSGPAKPGRMSMRSKWKARQLRKPVGESGHKSGLGSRPGQVRDRTTSTASRGAGRGLKGQRLRSVARTVAVLVAFAALVYGLHVLGFGPQ
jgi:hypothetical protein